MQSRQNLVSHDPEKYWEKYFISATPLPIITRNTLIARILDTDVRWIAINAVQGMGKSTLLFQLAEKIAYANESLGVIWTMNQAEQVFRSSRVMDDHRVIALCRYINSRAKQGVIERFTLLIDDYELSLTSEHKKLLDQLVAQLPQLRVITTAAESLHGREIFLKQQVTIKEFSGNDLLFNNEDIQQLITEFRENSPDITVKLSEAKNSSLLMKITRGIPIGVALAMDRADSANEVSEKLFSQAMHLYYTDTLLFELRAANRLDVSKLHLIFSLMPRFLLRHLKACFPELSAQMLQEFSAAPTIDCTRNNISGEYVWNKDFWVAAERVNATRIADRRDLAKIMHRHNYAAAAFEQWFLAGDFARAEAMLRTRFLTVYETLSPETARKISTTSPVEFAAYPMIRVMQTLLSPRVTPVELELCAENLESLGSRGGAAGLMALSVRAAILARGGQGKLGYIQANKVFKQASKILLGDDEETEAERRTIAEASLVAILTLCEIGYLPRNSLALPLGYGSPFLEHRLALVQHFLDLMRAEPVAEHLQPFMGTPVTYRALIFSEETCITGISAIYAHDEGFSKALAQESFGGNLDYADVLDYTEKGYGALEHNPPQKYFFIFAEFLYSLIVGNHVNAAEIAYREDTFEPQRSILQAIFLLTTGMVKDAYDILEKMDNVFGVRAKVTRMTLRAAVLHKLGQEESARIMLTSARSLSATVFLQALTLLHHDELQSLANSFSEFAEFIRLAIEGGVLGSGRQIMQTEKFEPLTAREIVVLEALREGLNTSQIAKKHHLSVNTVRSQVRSIGKKLKARGQQEMISRAHELHIIRKSAGDRR